MKKLFALMLAILMILTTVACATNSTPSAAGTAPAGQAAEAAPEAAKKDKLVIGQYGDTPNFDTHDNLNDNGMRINLVIYDPLVRMDNTTYEINPCVAESWTISPDGKEYTFKIKDGIQFSDGTNLTVDDVVFSLERGIKMPMAVPSFARVVSAEAVGTDSVKVTLDGPYPEFLFAMALPCAGILSKTAYETLGEDKYLECPITTGPYVVSDWKVGEKVTLTANEYYHMGEVPIKTVEWVVIGDPNSAVLSLESGDIDAYVDIPQSSYSRVEKNESLELHIGDSFGYDAFILNTSIAPFDNLTARKALAHAVDKESILYGIMDGNGSVADTFATPEYLGYTDAVTKYAYDLETAKALFAEAGVTEGSTLEIIVCTTQRSKIAQVLQNSLAEIGITANIQQLERSAFDDACLAGTANIIVDGSTYTAPTIDEAIYSGVHSQQMEIRNYSKYSNPEIDRLLDTARETTDETERAKLYNEFLILMSEELPVIPTVWNVKSIAASKALKGVSANPWSFYDLYEFSW